MREPEPPPDEDASPEPEPQPEAEAKVPDPPRRARHHDLPDMATRIREAQRQARERRVEQGLPADPDDGAYVLRKPRKHAPKRGKKHGQFLGTVCDSWEEMRRGGKQGDR